MEAEDDEGEAVEELVERRDEEALADPFDADDALHLGGLVDGVEVVEALDAVEIALMDGIDAQEAGASVRKGFAVLADGDGRGRVLS